MKNYVSEGKIQEVTVTNPTGPVSGGPVRVGSLTGVAVADEGDGGVSAATKTMVHFGPGIFSLSVVDHAGAGISVGDGVYYVDGAGDAAGTIESDNSGYFFGYALEAVAAGQTATIKVMKPSASGQTLGADTVTNTVLANIARGSVKVGGVDNAPTDLDCKTAGQIIVGDGTGVASVAVSVDASLSSAGVLRVLKMGVSPKGTVVAQANNVVLLAADLDKIHTNTGAGAGITVTLPAAATVAGKFVKLATTAAQTIQAVPAAGDKIYYGGSGAADKYLQIAGVIGNFADLVSDGTDWLCINGNGVITKQA